VKAYGYLERYDNTVNNELLMPGRADICQMAAQWITQNPALTACAAVGTTSLVIVAMPALVTAPILSAIGFTAQGVKAGK
jgi:pheromone shutdown protein TraB